jgi:hypothetical protein
LGQYPQLLAWMNKNFEIEFYYRSTIRDQIRALELLEATIVKAEAAGIQLITRKVDADAANISIPDGIPALPCLRRVSPTPERIIVGQLKTAEDICTVLGLPRPQSRPDGEKFLGWGV